MRLPMNLPLGIVTVGFLATTKECPMGRAPRLQSGLKRRGSRCVSD